MWLHLEEAMFLFLEIDLVSLYSFGITDVSSLGTQS